MIVIEVVRELCRTCFQIRQNLKNYHPEYVKMNDKEPKVLVVMKKVKTKTLRNMTQHVGLIYQVRPSVVNDSSRGLLHLIFALPCYLRT